jgi:hypothetical protein
VTIPDEAIEAAAKSLFPSPLDRMSNPATNSIARRALEAAMPHIRNEFARELREMDGEEWLNLRDGNDFPFLTDEDSHNNQVVDFAVICAEIGMEMAAQYIENGGDQ